MGDILVLAEHRQGELREVTLELLTLAGQLGGNVTAVLLGSGVDDFAGKVAGFADKVMVVDDPMFENFNPMAYQAALAELIKERQAGPGADRQHRPGRGHRGLARRSSSDLPFTTDVVAVDDGR